MYYMCPYLALRPKFLYNLEYLPVLPPLTPDPADINDPLVLPDLSLPLLHLFHQLLPPPLLYLPLLLRLLPDPQHVVYLPPLQLLLSIQEHLLVPQSPYSVLKHLQLVLGLLLLPERIQHHYTFLG
jgi:hypothetical protein